MVGCTDGFWRGQRFFNCPQNRGLFCQVSALQPRTPSLPWSSSSHFSRHFTPQIPPKSSVKESKPPLQNRAASLEISLNSAVQIGDLQKPMYGIVKWVGYIPRSNELVAGIELVSIYNNIVQKQLIYAIVCTLYCIIMCI